MRDFRQPTGPPVDPGACGEINAVADALGGLINILQNASPQDRANVYNELGVQLSYRPSSANRR